MNISNLVLLLILIHQGKALLELLKSSSLKTTTTQLGRSYYKTGELMHHFKLFQKKYRKQYKNSQEFERRYRNFKDNIAEAIRRNCRTQMVYGLSPYSDMSPDEIVCKMKSKFKGKIKKYDAKPINSEEAVKLSCDSFDWRTKNLVSPVRDQGNCKSSWAIAVAGAIESRYAIAHKFYKIPARLSVQQLIDCTPNADCEGGHPNQALEYASSFGGLIAEKRYPHRGIAGSCQAKSQVIKIRVRGGRSYLDDDFHLANFIRKTGPMIATIKVGHSFMFYKQGVATAEDFDCDKGQIFQTVLIVGFGTDEETGIPFWIIKNSFGEDWGEKGYFRLQRGKNACQINEQIIEPIIE